MSSVKLPCLEDIADRGEAYRKRAYFVEMCFNVQAWQNRGEQKLPKDQYERWYDLSESAITAMMIMGPRYYDELKEMWSGCIAAYRKSTNG